MTNDDNKKLWDYIQQVKQEQHDLKDKLSSIQGQLSELSAVFRERHQARESAVDKSIDQLDKTDIRQEGVLERHTGQIVELKLSRATFWGGLAALAGLSGVVSGIVAVIFGAWG